MSAPVHPETERLLMPPLSGRHTGALAEVYADPDVARHIGGATLDADGTAAQVARFEAVWHEPGFGQSALLDRATARSSAGPGCTPGRSGTRSSRASSSPGTRRAGGLATEAARAWPDVASGELGLHRLTAAIHPDNAASRALVTRLGFRVHREDVTPSRVRVLVLVHELVPAG
jgi:hypothetical protein